MQTLAKVGKVAIATFSKYQGVRLGADALCAYWLRIARFFSLYFGKYAAGKLCYNNTV